MLATSLDEVFGKKAQFGFREIDQMRDLISEAYEKLEADRLAQRVSTLKLKSNAAQDASDEESTQAEEEEKKTDTGKSLSVEEKEEMIKKLKENSALMIC